ncbi:MAG: NADH-ubiquinone oxidoreductase-F iron-sulfur binding region domain-containing protein [bacterium]|nr:NADH-ubiquinone oxidoreductase-F iron-sulfur binding region domain-containing protein [bacterium]MDY4099403.1 NADH-ubiquinone oxidoreductase-F iron-sulfur binding region domain-containing protein [Lachnospiraceae bacterium]
MALLRNQADALVKVQSINKDALEEIFGVWEPVEGKIVGALYNSDTDGRKKVLLHTNPAGVITGLKIAAVLTGAKEAVLVTDAELNEQELTANANMVKLPLTFEYAGMVNKTAHRQDLLLSLDQLASMAAKLLGEVPGVLLALDEGELSEVSADTQLDSLLREDVRGAVIDHKFYSRESLTGKTAWDIRGKSGVIHTITESQCVVDLLKKELLKLREKSCGKCVFCREGLYQCSQIVEDITNGRCKNEDVSLAKEIAEVMSYSTSCTLGDDAAAPVLSVYENFADELDAHAKRKECKKGVCLALTQIYIDPAKCGGCGACAEVCPENCIESKAGYVSVIDGFDCTRCGKCLETCEKGAVVKTSGRLPKLPNKPTRVKGAKVETKVETTAETAEKKERTGARRRRSFGSATGGVKPVTAAVQAAEKSEPTAAVQTGTETTETTVTRTVGKRKRVYARAKSSSDNN